MYEIIEAAEGLDESGLPNEAYMPGENGEHVPVDTAGGYHVQGGQGNMVFDADRHQ